MAWLIFPYFPQHPFFKKDSSLGDSILDPTSQDPALYHEATGTFKWKLLSGLYKPVQFFTSIPTSSTHEKKRTSLKRPLKSYVLPLSHRNTLSCHLRGLFDLKFPTTSFFQKRLTTIAYLPRWTWSTEYFDFYNYEIITTKGCFSLTWIFCPVLESINTLGINITSQALRQFHPYTDWDNIHFKQVKKRSFIEWGIVQV